MLINIKPRARVAQGSVFRSRDQTKGEFTHIRANHRVMQSLLTACSAVFFALYTNLLPLLCISGVGSALLLPRRLHTSNTGKLTSFVAPTVLIRISTGKHPRFCLKRFLCQMSPKKENSHMASSHLHYLILLCSIILLNWFLPQKQ